MIPKNKVYTAQMVASNGTHKQENAAFDLPQNSYNSHW